LEPFISKSELNQRAIKIIRTTNFQGIMLPAIPDFARTVVSQSQPERVEKKNFFFVMCRFCEFGKIYLSLSGQIL
jgi:hypothetical protein